MDEELLNKAALARRMGVSKQLICRYFSEGMRLDRAIEISRITGIPVSKLPLRDEPIIGTDQTP